MKNTELQERQQSDLGWTGQAVGRWDLYVLAIVNGTKVNQIQIIKERTQDLMKRYLRIK